MNAVGYDAMALGNHEFDYGQDVLAERIREAKFPMLSANVIVEATKAACSGFCHIQKGM
ncbi:MAG: hypothetical protein ACLUIQ_10115 [Dialister invisus]